MEAGLDVFKITIDPSYAGEGEDLSMDKIAFTSNPAIKVKGMAFNASTKQYYADSQETPKMRVAAPAMIPMEIYRNDSMGEYYVQFTREEIENIHKNFMMNLTNQGKFNLEHSETQTVPAYILECWLVGDNNEADRSYSEFGVKVPAGSLFMVAQITDEKYYTNLIKNDQIGFSIEGLFGLKFNEFGGNVPSEIKIEQQMNENLVLPDGEHTIEDKIYVVKDGQVTEIKDVVKASADETPAEQVTETPAEEVPAEQVTEQKMAITPEEVMTVVQPKLDEIYGAIADLKALIEGQVNHEQTEIEAEPMQMSAHQKYAEVIKFASK